MLDDTFIRQENGLVRTSHLAQIWLKTKDDEQGYAKELHPMFIRLMERFDLMYEVADSASKGSFEKAYLVGQLVNDLRPQEKLDSAWQQTPPPGHKQKIQICQILDEKNNPANAEGLFYRTIVRQHRYSLGRNDFSKSVHWKRGLVLHDERNGTALLEHLGTDIRVTVRAPYPDTLLNILTEDVHFLVRDFWQGLKCEISVPCITEKCRGTFDIKTVREAPEQHVNKLNCPVCRKWHEVKLLSNDAPGETVSIKEVKIELSKILSIVQGTDVKVDGVQSTLSRIENEFNLQFKALIDIAKDGPRLFTFVPVDRTFFGPQVTTKKYRLSLWCEHSKRPLNEIDGSDNGIYEIEIQREYFKKIAPGIKVISNLAKLALPIGLAGLELKLDDSAFANLEEQLNLGDAVANAFLDVNKDLIDHFEVNTDHEPKTMLSASDSAIRAVHALLRDKDPSFGGLERVITNQKEFLWVHPQYKSQY